MSKHSLFNSFLLAVCLAVMGWVAHKAADSVERKIDDTVPRREFDSRMLAIETEQRKADIHLREIDLEILKLKQNIR